MKSFDLEKFSLEKKVPLLKEDSAKFICEVLAKRNSKSLLEIGTGIGYSSVFFLENSCLNDILTIEKDPDRFLFIKENLVKLYSDKIAFINTDAFEFVPEKKFDVIFLDGPKANQIKLFDKYANYLSENGLIIIDNIFLEKVKSIQSSRAQKLFSKVEEFVQYLKKLENWKVNFYNIGDGLAICERNNEIISNMREL